MKYVIGAAVGLLWGAVIAWLNSRISKRAIAKNSTGAIMTANLCRSALDIVGLGVVFLLRKALPFSFEATIVGTAVALGMLTVVFAFQLAKPEKGNGAADGQSAIPDGEVSADHGAEEPDGNL